MIKFSLKKNLHAAAGAICLDVDCAFNDGEFVTLFGPSGAGKTSILRMLAGLMRPDAGRIEVGSEVWFDSTQNISWSVDRRTIGYVAQGESLFPNMTVRRHLQYALGKDKDPLIDELLALTDLTGLAGRYPHELSGGQKQRVALGRAIIRRPRLLLFDEPFSALDAHLRAKMQEEIARLYRHFKITTLFVSHDLSEIFKLSERIFWIKEGRIVKEGSPRELFAGESLSGKFKFTGHIVAIDRKDLVNVITIQIGEEITKIVATDEELAGMMVGDSVVVSAKAFNPIVLKINGS